MKYMVFFIRGNEASRSEPLDSFDAAIEAARKGPPGAFFQISDISVSEYRIRLEGYVAS